MSVILYSKTHYIYIARYYYFLLQPSQGFKTKYEFFVTQLPLPDTVVDFWRLIKDHKCSAILYLQPSDEQVSMIIQVYYSIMHIVF